MAGIASNLQAKRLYHISKLDQPKDRSGVVSEECEDMRIHGPAQDVSNATIFLAAVPNDDLQG